MNEFVRTDIIGLQFLGSNDGSTYTNIFTVGEEVHEGWNYYEFSKTGFPKYRYYRFQGSKVNSCQVGEIKFMGYEGLNSATSTHECAPQLYLNNVLQDFNETIVTYSAALTPKINKIVPRYGSVIGNEPISFIGENFNTDMGTISI